MEQCIGCIFKEYCIYIKYAKLCPCGTCIIKMMCRKVCRKYLQFTLSEVINIDTNALGSVEHIKIKGIDRYSKGNDYGK